MSVATYIALAVVLFIGVPLLVGACIAFGNQER